MTRYETINSTRTAWNRKAIYALFVAEGLSTSILKYLGERECIILRRSAVVALCPRRSSAHAAPSSCWGRRIYWSSTSVNTNSARVKREVPGKPSTRVLSSREREPRGCVCHSSLKLVQREHESVSRWSVRKPVRASFFLFRFCSLFCFFFFFLHECKKGTRRFFERLSTIAFTVATFLSRRCLVRVLRAL